jgi:hypothetical protein
VLYWESEDAEAVARAPRHLWDLEQGGVGDAGAPGAPHPALGDVEVYPELASFFPDYGEGPSHRVVVPHDVAIVQVPAVDG